MLSSISWQQFISFLLIANAIYYLFIWLVFFKGRIPAFPRIPTMLSFFGQGGEEPDEVMTTAQHVMDEIRPLFGGRHNKNELLLALQSPLSKYSAWEEPGFRDTVNAFILSLSESKCSIRLSEDDLSALWK